MEISHRTHNLKIAPRKLRLVIDQMRYKEALKALDILPLIINKGAGLAYKSLASAVQVAKDNDLQPESLVIAQVWVDEGMKLKRVVGRSRGQMDPIHKHHSHLSIVLRGEPAVRGKVRRSTKEVTVEPVLNQPTETVTE